mmetsp:Transcript_10479/g.14708  ORF Transcript_10479/g.14708 Transcript_10479/m.14708 type:complete len:186 (+) Transcript_10479:114-671(+)
MVGRLFKSLSRRSNKRGVVNPKKDPRKTEDGCSSVNTCFTDTESVSRSSTEDCRRPEDISVGEGRLSSIANNGESCSSSTTPVLLSLASARRLPTKEQLDNNTSSKNTSSIQLLGKIDPQAVVKPNEFRALATAEASTPPLAPVPVKNEKEYHGSPTINQLREKKRQRELLYSKRKLNLETSPVK